MSDGNSRKAFVLLSGGLDSATVLLWAIHEGYNCTALSINFFMRSPNERAAVKHITQMLKIPLIEIEIPFVKEASNLVEEHYPLPYQTYPEGYVPMRNLIFYSLAAYYAEIYGIDTIIGGHLESDPHAFPDSSPQFFNQLQQLINSTRLPNNLSRITFLMPFAGKSKVDVLRLAFELHVPLEYTWSCYWEVEVPCGSCVACRERIEAFQVVGHPDPLLIRVKK